jgi:hypothetical protein
LPSDRSRSFPADHRSVRPGKPHRSGTGETNLLEQLHFDRQVPAMEHVPHYQHVSRRQLIAKNILRNEMHAGNSRTGVDRWRAWQTGRHRTSSRSVARRSAIPRSTITGTHRDERSWSRNFAASSELPLRLSPSLCNRPCATSASKKSRAERSCNPNRRRRLSASKLSVASSANRDSAEQYLRGPESRCCLHDSVIRDGLWH